MPDHGEQNSRYLLKPGWYIFRQNVKIPFSPSRYRKRKLKNWFVFNPASILPLPWNITMCSSSINYTWHILVQLASCNLSKVRSLDRLLSCFRSSEVSCRLFNTEGFDRIWGGIDEDESFKMNEGLSKVIFWKIWGSPEELKLAIVKDSGKIWFHIL